MNKVHMLRRITCLAAVFCLTLVASAQSWMSAYDAALVSARKADWSAARSSFKQAIASRPEDYAKATNLPGPATEKRMWRNGSPYSPNFLAAYANFKLASTEKDATAKKKLLDDAAAEFEALIAKSQLSYEAFYFLNSIYSEAGDNVKRLKLEEKYTQSSGQLTWKVDVDLLTPEEIASVGQMAGQDIQQPAVPTNPNEGPIPSNPVGTTPPLLSAGGVRVPINPTKYALIIGNSQTKMDLLKVVSSADDAQLIRESLMSNAGYAEKNVDLVIDATAAQIRASAQALADRLPEGATVFIFFSGVGANLDGKDYLAGVDTESVTDSSSMISKSELYKMFGAKDARIFAFFQSNRTITNGRYFGAEVPMVGKISQMQGTIPGSSVQSYTSNGKGRGLFADALAGTLGEFRTNRVPVQEFGWQVFYRIRRGGTGTTGGGSQQTPTLPVLINMASDARF